MRGMVWGLALALLVCGSDGAHADPISALIVGAIGLTGTAATVGSALLTTAIGFGLQFAASRIQPKQKAGVTAARVGLKIDTNAPRQVILGETATGGSLVFWHLSGSSNEKLWMVIALADHECTSLQSVIVSGKLKSWDSGTGLVADYSGKLKVRFYAGTMSQTADSALVAASGGRWTGNEVGAGVCYVVVEADFDEKVFPDGIPELGFIIRGAKLFDPRTSTTAYSRNAAVAVSALLRGISVGGEPLIGMNVSATAIRAAEIEASANACDEDVPLKAGGTEKRYQCNVILDCDQNNRDHIEVLVASMAGEVIESGGIYRILAGVAQSPVAFITDDDLISGEPLAYRPKRGRNQLVNAVTGSYFDPSRNYVPVGLPPRTSSTDEDEDGGIRLTTTLDLQAVTSRTQAQRVQEIERRKARRMGTVSGQLRARWFVLEPGDWITFTSARRGFSSKTFEITSGSGIFDLRSDVVLSEIDAGFDDWSTALEIDDGQVIDLPPAGPSFTTVTGVALANFVIAGATTEQRPGLRITWTPVTDPTIVRLDLEYRKIGDTVALQKQISQPGAGSYEWLDGVQGNVQYEARLKPVAVPDRTTSFTAWAQVPADAAPQVVSLAALALAVPPDTITPEMLSAQSRFELSLVTARAEIQGSVSSQVADLRVDLERVAQSIMSTTAFQSRQMQAVRRTVDGQTVTVSELLEVTEGLAGSWTVQVDLDGRVLAAVRLDGSETTSGFTVLASNFVVADPAHPDITPFVVSPEGILLDGVVVKDGTITAEKLSVPQVSAFVADLGLITAGRLQNADNTTYLDLNTGDFQIG